MRKLPILSFVAFLSVGCDEAYLDHPYSTSDFEDAITLNWHSGTEVDSWSYQIEDLKPLGHQVQFSLYLYDGDRKHLMMATSTKESLPDQSSQSHEELSAKVLEGGWYLWMDYELYSPDGDLLLKGTKLSEPSPKLVGANEPAEQGAP